LALAQEGLIFARVIALNNQLVRSIHRRGAELPENSQRKEKKLRKRREEKGGGRSSWETSILLLLSARILCVLCASAVNGLYLAMNIPALKPLPYGSRPKNLY
jgi:hypothetical protein